MKIKRIIFGMLIFSGSLCAQHTTRFSQYSLNASSINPAFTGIEDYVDFKLGFREQWSGFEDAPKGFFFNLNGVITRSDPSQHIHNSLRVSDPAIYEMTEYQEKKRLRHGLGLILQSESQTPFKQASYLATYSLHLPLNDKLNLALGTSFGLFQRSIDVGVDFEVKDKSNDALYQALLENGGRQTAFDINMGLLLYSDKLFLGLSAMPIVSSDISKESIIANEDNLTLVGIAGLRFDLNEKWSFTPSVVARIREPTNPGYDINMKFSRSDYLWFGLSYRENKTTNLNIGLLFNTRYSISYSYDYSFTELNTVSSGSHEFVLGLSLSKENHHRSLIW